jgi:hypothetical protein
VLIRSTTRSCGSNVNLQLDSTMIWLELLPTLNRANATQFRSLPDDRNPNKALQWSGGTGRFRMESQRPPPTDLGTYDPNSGARQRIGRSWTAPKPNVLARERRRATRQEASPGAGVVFGMEAERCVDDLLGLSPASRVPRPKRNEFRSTIRSSRPRPPIPPSGSCRPWYGSSPSASRRR